MRVLIVADDAALADLIKLSLRCGFYEKGKRLARTGGRITDGLEVEHVLRPEDALRFLAETSEHVDVILADLQADPRDGLGFLETCRGQYRDKYGEIIALAERRRVPDAQSCLEAGVKEFIFKPFTPQELTAHVLANWKNGPR